MELLNCQGLAVPKEVMHHVVHVESSYNPYAIGVVGARLMRQPRSLPEALATVRMLEDRGYNFSLGLAQINRYNLGKYDLDSYEQAFQVCPNVQAGSRILAECHSRSKGDWGKSFSCYYSGNFVTGYRHGYVQKVYASMRAADASTPSRPASGAIEVVSKPSRRAVNIARYPMRAAGELPAPGTGAVIEPPASPYSKAQSSLQPVAETSGVGVIAAVKHGQSSPVELEATTGKPSASTRDAAFVF